MVYIMCVGETPDATLIGEPTMTMIALVHSHYDPSHLADVVAEMAVLGAPTIRAVWMESYGCWAAIEGCHRLRAALALGLTPTIEEVDYSDDEAPGAQDGATIAEICDNAYRSVILEF